MPFIKLKNVSLEYPGVVHKRGMRIASTRSATAPGGKMKLDSKDRLNVSALDDISLDIQAGDRVALVGHNGAGKSTLLRTMAGLYKPTKGVIQVDGKIAPLFNLNFGIDAEASGYENILIRGLYLGMSKDDIESKLNAIAEFCELGDFLHLPVRTYSSGMSARLGFAISTHIDAEILLLDEAIGTGDAAFFKKACLQIENFINNANVMVLASHSNKILRQFCQKGVLLEHGKIVLSGPLDDVLHCYRDIQKQGDQVSIAGNDLSQFEASKLSGSLSDCFKETNILLLNDTGNSSNPGCRAVHKAFDAFFSSSTKNDGNWSSIPVHYWAKSFVDLSCTNQFRVKKETGKFTVGTDVVPDVDYNQWEKIRINLKNNDTYIMSKFKASDIVFVNGEGSIHHNAPRGLALLALMKAAAEEGHKVILANSTIQAMSPKILQDVLPQLTLVHVREEQSQKYLKSLGLSSLLTADIAFSALDESKASNFRYLNSKDYVLVTSSVLVSERGLKSLFNSVNEIGKKPIYLCIGDGGEKEVASTACEEMGVPIIQAADIPVDEIVDFLAQFPLAISGRHHINIFLMRAEVPFVPIPSNTWKIEETINFVKYPIMPVVSEDEVAEALRMVQADHSNLVESCKASFIKGRASINLLIKALAECGF